MKVLIGLDGYNNLMFAIFYLGGIWGRNGTDLRNVMHRQPVLDRKSWLSQLH